MPIYGIYVNNSVKLRNKGLKIVLGILLPIYTRKLW